MHLTPDQERILAGLRAQGMSAEAAQLEGKIIETHLSKQRAKLNQPATYGTDNWLARFITQCPAMLKMKERVKKLAMIQDPVMILGPTGTGKELIAQALHGSRIGQFVDINCAGLPSELIEHELFGSVEGSFTGSKKDKQGLLAAAHGGTVFLDEIGELKLDVQAKLLRAIETMTIRRVGSNVNEPISCRFVCATKQPLEKWVELERFREDLYWRLSAFEIKLTPLHERLGDCPLIAEYYYGKPFIYKYTDWESEDLSGNVRSIKHIVRRYEVFGSELA